MKFEINRTHLLNGLSDVMKAISHKVTLPILTGIKIELEEQGVTMTGSDSDITICSFIPTEEDGELIIETFEKGSIVVQARYFSDIVRKLPTDTVLLEVINEQDVIIRSGRSEFKLIGSKADEYPILPNMEKDIQFTIATPLLKSIIRETGFAVSTQETRPVLTGVNWVKKEDALYCIATDSHRLARRITALDDLPEGEFQAVIPGKSLQELNKIIDKEESVDILFTEQQVLFKTERILFYSRLLEGTYPDTTRLIPTEYQTSIVLKSKEFLQAIDRASLLARDERNNIVRLVTTDQSTVELTSNSPEVGKVEEIVAATSIEGEALQISFSAKYMMDALRAIESEEIVIHFTGVMRPFILKAVDSEAVLQLILPVRTY